MGTMNLQLPDDILYLICDQVRSLPHSAGILFNSAISGKQMAPLALANLYRHARSPGNYDENWSSMSDLDQMIMKWAIMWRSIYMASKKRTLYPYASYLRFADLRDLAGLLDHPRFQRQIATYFLEGDLADLAPKTPSKAFGRTFDTRIVEAIGDAIMSENTMIEGVSGNFGVDAMQRWISKLPRLRRLELWGGEVLAHDQTQDTICEHCPYFRELSIYSWKGKEADSHLGPFFERLPRNTLTDLKTISACGVESQTCVALNRHPESLTDLHLIFEPSALGVLGELKSCTALERLHLEFSTQVNLQLDQPGTFNEFSAWLGQCKQMKELELVNIASGSSAIVPMLLDPEVQLDELTIQASSAPFFTEASESFSYALTHQTSLTALDLVGDGEVSTDAQINNFIESVAQLVKLKKLELRGIMDNFDDDHIVRLLLSLDQLEDIFIGGMVFTDVTLHSIGGSLSNLKRWTIMAPSRFSADALLSFIDKLDEHGNEGLQLSVDMADPEYLLSSEEQVVVRSALRVKVGGTLDYTPLRDPDQSDSEDYSD